ncbi:hypothetical protein ANN_09399 [Periplaneta americana]|uniref:Uncharacterized protein n=1 Tax=Periplaneta americana TaxID=6978 RepID=A0ABQ8TNF4_PERAM|nr:hypothetical protein ANN_09399 [Periplaneta americana]
MYEQRYPGRRHQHHTTFAAIHTRLGETENLRPRPVGGGRRDVRTPDFENVVVERFSEEPSTSTRAVARAKGHLHLRLTHKRSDPLCMAYHPYQFVVTVVWPRSQVPRFESQSGQVMRFFRVFPQPNTSKLGNFRCWTPDSFHRHYHLHFIPTLNNLDVDTAS